MQHAPSTFQSVFFACIIINSYRQFITLTITSPVNVRSLSLCDSSCTHPAFSSLSANRKLTLERGLTSGMDEERNCAIIDEDRVSQFSGGTQSAL
jgi:hypothetical protein